MFGEFAFFRVHSKLGVVACPERLEEEEGDSLGPGTKTSLGNMVL